MANRFHYYRLTADDRILWGGYDAIYHFGNGIGPERAQRDATFARLAQHFFRTFPQLEDLRFTHRWGGPIDTCSRFFAFYGLSHGGPSGICRRPHRASASARAASAPAWRSTCSPAARPRRRARSWSAAGPFPFPPEPAALGGDPGNAPSAGASRPAPGPPRAWLRLLDRLGLGYDS